MLDHQLRRLGISDQRVLAAMRQVPREQFVPPALCSAAYDNRALPIGYDQSISQPLVVAQMTQVAQPRTDSKALDIGTGSGYQAAILSLLVDHVYSIEIVEPLATAARDRLARLGYNNVTVRHGDGRRGWPEQMPFDLILGAAAPLAIPPALIDQLAPGGRLTMPVGPASGQQLMLVEKRADGSIHEQAITPVSFVPMTGDDQA